MSRTRPRAGCNQYPSPWRVGASAGAGGARRPPPTGSEVPGASELLAKPGAQSPRGSRCRPG
eukprot:303004-Pleurochrysis_carterae.AAC.1